MTDKGYDNTFAHNVFEQIKGFAGYGFPESHSASFAVLAYVSCWLKFYFPVEFYVALLNSWPMGFYTPSQLVQDAKRHNIHVEAPCVNKSDTEHTLVIVNQEKHIQLGLKLITNPPTCCDKCLGVPNKASVKLISCCTRFSCGFKPRLASWDFHGITLSRRFICLTTKSS